MPPESIRVISSVVTFVPRAYEKDREEPVLTLALPNIMSMVNHKDIRIRGAGYSRDMSAAFC